LVLLVAPSSAHATRGLNLGFLDSVYSSDERDPWLDRTVAVNANTVRVDIGWPVVDTPARPASFDARNPADPHYDFSSADASIVAASARGLRVLATSPARRAPADASCWRPSPEGARRRPLRR